ncbi:MAG: hypothetical protein HY908_11680 [Myxococcales bacterium]|nr:hypothetical protein [Myxococcales bacterium]
MPPAVAATSVLLLALAATAFVAGVWAFTTHDDLLALAACAFGAATLRTVTQLTRAAGGGS